MVIITIKLILKVHWSLDKNSSFYLTYNNGFTDIAKLYSMEKAERPFNDRNSSIVCCFLIILSLFYAIFYSYFKVCWIFTDHQCYLQNPFLVWCVGWIFDPLQFCRNHLNCSSLSQSPIYFSVTKSRLYSQSFFMNGMPWRAHHHACFVQYSISYYYQGESIFNKLLLNWRMMDFMSLEVRLPGMNPHIYCLRICTLHFASFFPFTYVCSRNLGYCFLDGQTHLENHL